MRIANQICIITGGGSGIGRAASLQFAAEGGNVVVADLHLDAAQATVDLITVAGGKALAVAVDVGDSAQVQAVIAKAVSTHGSIDVIVNDAAMMTFTPIVDIVEAAFIGHRQAEASAKRRGWVEAEDRRPTGAPEA